MPDVDAQKADAYGMPGVTVDKLPQLSVASGGAVPDPSPVETPAEDTDSETGA